MHPGYIFGCTTGECIFGTLFPPIFRDCISRFDCICSHVVICSHLMNHAKKKAVGIWKRAWSSSDCISLHMQSKRDMQSRRNQQKRSEKMHGKKWPSLEMHPKCTLIAFFGPLFFRDCISRFDCICSHVVICSWWITHFSNLTASSPPLPSFWSLTCKDILFVLFVFVSFRCFLFFLAFFLSFAFWKFKKSSRFTIRCFCSHCADANNSKTRKEREGFASIIKSACKK